MILIAETKALIPSAIEPDNVEWFLWWEKHVPQGKPRTLHLCDDQPGRGTLPAVESFVQWTLKNHDLEISRDPDRCWEKCVHRPTDPAHGLGWTSP